MRMRGARPSPRHKLAAARPHRIIGATPAQFIVVPSLLSMWLNDVDGDCVTAEEAFAKACHSPEIFIQDATVKTWAQQHGVLNGAALSDVLEWMQTGGFQQDGETYNDGPAAAVDWTNAAMLCNAIAHGPVKTGVAAAQLENVVGNSNGWLAVNFQHDPNLDHCVSACGFGPIGWLAQQLGTSINSGALGIAVYTWKTIGIIDAASWLAIVGEAWLRSPTTVIPTQPTPVPSPMPPPVPPVSTAMFSAPIQPGSYTLSPAA